MKKQREPKVIHERLALYAATRPAKGARSQGLGETFSALPKDVQVVLQRMQAIVMSRARQSNIPVEDLELALFEDPEEGWKRVVLRVRVKLNAVQALAFWDSLGPELNMLRKTLSPGMARSLVEDVSLDIVWE